MDFLSEQDISALLTELGVVQLVDGDGCVLMQMDKKHSCARHCLCNTDCPCEDDPNTLCNQMDADGVVNSLVASIHKIHEGRTLMIPASKWRVVFDAVAFSMAEDESWQEFDASATIKLNTRDPLLFEAGDKHTLIGLITSLMNDGETKEQSVFIIPVGAPILIHLQPCGPVNFWFGNSALADEVKEHYAG